MYIRVYFLYSHDFVAIFLETRDIHMHFYKTGTYEDKIEINVRQMLEKVRYLGEGGY
jgi:hypothetical protein